jgi:hypothetical protein
MVEIALKELLKFFKNSWKINCNFNGLLIVLFFIIQIYEMTKQDLTNKNCPICGKGISLGTFYHHIRKIHKTSLKEYR